MVGDGRGPVRARGATAAPSALPDGTFGVRLDAALGARGLALERVCERLRSAGIALSPSTLSLWRHGRSRPRRNEAMRAVAELESVLRTPRGYLLDALVRRAPTRHWSAERSSEDPVQRVREEMGLDEGDTLQRLLVHHRVELDAQRRVTAVRIRRVLRATREPVSRIGVTAHGTADSSLRLVPRPGTSVGRQRCWRDRGLLFAELVLDEPIAPGDLGTLDYSVLPAAPACREDDDEGGYAVHTEFPVSTIVVEARFSPAALPAAAGATVRSRAARRAAAEQPVTVGGDGSAVTVVHGLDEGSVRLRWTWGPR
jgi:transcriptional regulator with XRE-family HTH domain